MKKVLILLPIFICCQQMRAQNAENVFGKNAVRTQSNHFIDIGIIDAGYTYEYAFADHYTISGGAGITGNVSYTSTWYDGNKWRYSLHPYVSVESRYYYNLQKRVRNGKSIDGNTGSFLAVQCNF